jgi:hypothetical protein
MTHPTAQPTTHSPAPWTVTVWEYPTTIAAPSRKELNIQNEDYLLATLQCDFTGDNTFTIPQGEAEANARLIAAAPALLAACELVQRAWVGDGVEMASAVDACLLAIAQADGGVR